MCGTVYFTALPRSNFIRIITFNHDMCSQGRKQVTLFICLSDKDVLLHHAVIAGAGLTLAFLAFLHRLDYSRIHDVGMLELREKLGMHRLAIGNRTIRHNTSRPDVRRTLWFGERRANKIVHNVATMQHKGEDMLWVGSGDRWWTSKGHTRDPQDSRSKM